VKRRKVVAGVVKGGAGTFSACALAAFRSRRRLARPFPIVPCHLDRLGLRATDESFEQAGVERVVDDGDLVADCVVAVDVAVLCNNIQSRRPPNEYNYWYLYHFLITHSIHLRRQSHQYIGIKRRDEILYEEERTRTRGERKRVNARP
jgi:hypothetical protein